MLLQPTALRLLVLILLRWKTFTWGTSVFTTQSDFDKPKLVLIGGCSGTGKSTLGMNVALDQGILKCVSTDTIRSVMRSFISKNSTSPLHRSSYAPSSDNDDPVESWLETCDVLEASIEEIVIDSIRRRQGLVLEGVSIIPSSKLIKIWEDGGGIAIGCLLQITNADTHKSLLRRRRDVAGVGSEQYFKDKEKIALFDRIRKIQSQMVKLAEESNWILMEQKVELDPLEIIAKNLCGEEVELAVSSRSINVKEGGDMTPPMTSSSIIVVKQLIEK